MTNINKNYLFFLLVISILLNCWNFLKPTTSKRVAPTLSSPSTSSTFLAFKKLMGAEPVPIRAKRPQPLVPLHKIKMSQPLSECSTDNLNNTRSAPLIAIMAASVTRTVSKPSLRSLSLFRLLLPSLATSLDCGFRYIFVLGFDEGDAFYDSEIGFNKTEDWFERKVRLPLLRRNIQLTMTTLRVANRAKKPGPVFLAMAREAYDLGADYFYRVNDDTYLQGKWPSFFVNSLMSLPPPHGVIGPSSEQTDDRILTHDFVHRLHMEVFPHYYPPELTDWWMDDWISHVYGRRRSLVTEPRGDVSVLHYTSRHKTRYKVDFRHEQMLPGLVAEGQRAVFDWMMQHKRPLQELNDFRESCAGPEGLTIVRTHPGGGEGGQAAANATRLVQ